MIHPARLSILAAVVVLGCTTLKTSPAAPAKPAVQRAPYTPRLVFTSFGDVDFDRDAAVARRYLATLGEAQSPCVPGARTAREKRDGLPGTGKCPPVDVAASTPTPVMVLVDSVPEGFELSNGRIQPPDGVKLVGRMKWEVPTGDIKVPRDALIVDAEELGRVKKAEIVDELKYVARAASANLVLISFIDEKTDKAHGATGLLFHVDLSAFDATKSRRGKVPVEI
jgi:hypothetical protein